MTIRQPLISVVLVIPPVAVPASFTALVLVSLGQADPTGKWGNGWPDWSKVRGRNGNRRRGPIGNPDSHVPWTEIHQSFNQLKGYLLASWIATDEVRKRANSSSAFVTKQMLGPDTTVQLALRESRCLQPGEPS